MAEDALAFVRRNQSKPFFLFLAFTIPHQKLQVPNLESYADQSWPENLKKIAAMITRMDGDIGRLMALLKELNLDENTLVFFASDNGAVYRDATFNHSGPLRGFKRDMYEGGLRSPSIARWPGHIKAGSVSDQVWALWDVLPTLAQLTSQTTPAGLDGVSILSALLEEKEIQHPPLYFEFHERGFDQAARIDDWKAVRHGLAQPIELYDLKSDLAERHDVSAENPAVVKKFEDYFKTARTDSQTWPIRERPKANAAN
jgi:arylsulfatase A-like enzyme